MANTSTFQRPSTSKQTTSDSGEQTTFQRPSTSKQTTSDSGEQTTFQRPSTSKQTTSDSGEQTQSGTRPTSRVDHPAGKQQYMDKDQRIDHPEGKQQYMDKERPTSRVDQPGRPVEKNPVPEIKDPSNVKCTLKLTVKAIKSDKDNVLLQVLGTNYVGKKLPFTVSYNERVYANGLDDAWKLVKLGATVELKKIVTIEFPIY